jgi:hypothetical protein
VVHQHLARAAHWHAERGLAVFPLVPGTKRPAVKQDWEHQATTNHSQISKIWRHTPYNIGIATGRSVLLVVDLDQPKSPTDVPPEPWRGRGVTTGADVLAWLAAAAGSDLPATWTVRTTSGGQHLYFRQPSGLELGNSAGRLGWKIDTRGHGGYVLGAGSIIDHTRYQLTRNLPAQELPDWIATALTRAPETTTPVRRRNLKHTSAYALAALTGELDKLLAASEGHRNQSLNSAAFALGQLIAAGLLDHAVVRDELISAAGRIGLPRREAERTITSGLGAGVRHPRRI